MMTRIVIHGKTHDLNTAQGRIAAYVSGLTKLQQRVISMAENGWTYTLIRKELASVDGIDADAIEEAINEAKYVYETLTPDEMAAGDE